MTKVTRITVQPRTVSTGAPVTVRLAGGGNVMPYRDAASGNQYRAGVVAPLRLQAAIQFDLDTGNGWTGVTVPSTATINWASSGGVLGSAKADLAAMAAYYWPNAAITVSEGDEIANVFTTRLTGKVADAQVQNHQLAITIADLSVGLSQPLVSALFGGTGGADGDTSATNRIKRRTWGRVFNVEGRVIDAANDVYEFGDPAFPWQAIDKVRDVGREAAPVCIILAWQGSIAATFAALQASAPVRGSGVVAPSIACCKWWTQPVGPLTADIRGEIGAGYVETCPEIAAAIMTAVGGPAVSNVAAGKALRPGIAGIHVDEGEDINAALNRLLFGVSLVWNLNAGAGTITLAEFTFSGPVDSIVSNNAERTKTLQPVKTRRIGYQRAYRVHSDGEIASSLLILGLQASADAFTYVDGVASPGGQTITFTATGLDSGEAVNFMTSPIVTLTGTGLTRTMAIADFGANTQVTVTATGVTSGATGQVNVGRQDKSTSEAGADVTKHISGPATSSITANVDGSIPSDAVSNFAQNFRLIRSDGSDFTTSATWSVSVDAGSATASIALNGSNATLSLSAFAATSDLTITATLASVAVDHFHHKITKVQPTASVGGGGGGGGGSNPGTTGTGAISGTIPNTTAYVAVTPVIQAVAGTAGQVACTLPVDYTVNGNTSGGVACDGKWTWRVVGGTMADIATEQGPGSASTWDSSTATRTTASMVINMTKTGLTAGTTYEFQGMMRTTSARSATAAGTSGANASAAGS